MAQFTKTQVIQMVKDTGIVPVFFHQEKETARQILKACYDGGVRVAEFTNRGDFAWEIFTDLRKYALREMPEMALGVGTVVDAPTAAIYMQSGADFVVSPILDQETARICNRRKVPWVPGCGSVTEIARAHEHGADLVKVFPGSQVGGPGFVKAVRGPMPWTDIIPTGGVAPTEENLREWFSAGVIGVGMGSKMIRKEWVDKRQFDAIRNQAAEAIQIVQKIRQSNL